MKIGVVGLGLIGGSMAKAIKENTKHTVLAYDIKESEYLNVFAEVGVIFVMFTAGLETNLKDVKSTGAAAFAVAACGVVLPLAAGTGIGALFLPNAEHGVFSWLFIGVIMTAT